MTTITIHNANLQWNEQLAVQSIIDFELPHTKVEFIDDAVDAPIRVYSDGYVDLYHIVSKEWVVRIVENVKFDYPGQKNIA